VKTIEKQCKYMRTDENSENYIKTYKLKEKKTVKHRSEYMKNCENYVKID